MGFTFFIILIIAEIALITLTFTKFTEKLAWLKNRTLTTAIEVVILLAMVLLPTTYMKWRFAAAVAILLIRLVFELIRLAVKHKKASGTKHKATTIISGVLSIIFVGLALVAVSTFVIYVIAVAVMYFRNYLQSKSLDKDLKIFQKTELKSAQ